MCLLIRADEGPQSRLGPLTRPTSRGESFAVGDSNLLDVLPRLPDELRTDSVPMVLHDFNNLLAGITGFAQLGLEEVPPDSPAVETLSEIRQLSDRAARLVGQLLALSRARPGSQAPNHPPAAIDLNSLIDHQRRMLAELAGKKITLDWRPAADLTPARADAAQIEQILVNLVTNARDAMGQGAASAGRLTIETANVSSPPGKYVRLTVSDTGCGMTDEVRARIFEPFFSTKPQGQGTGLGLAMVYRIVQRHGGRIVVRSQPGQGATFDIYLPVAETAAQTGTTAESGTAEGDRVGSSLSPCQGEGFADSFLEK